MTLTMSMYRNIRNILNTPLVTRIIFTFILHFCKLLHYAHYALCTDIMNSFLYETVPSIFNCFCFCLTYHLSIQVNIEWSMSSESGCCEQFYVQVMKVANVKMQDSTKLQHWCKLLSSIIFSV